MWSYAIVSTVICSYLVQTMSNIHSINRCSIFYHPDFKGQPLNLFHTIQIIWKKKILFKPFCCAHYYSSISLLCKYEWSSTSHRAQTESKKTILVPRSNWDTRGLIFRSYYNYVSATRRPRHTGSSVVNGSSRSLGNPTTCFKSCP